MSVFALMKCGESGSHFTIALGKANYQHANPLYPTGNLLHAASGLAATAPRR